MAAVLVDFLDADGHPVGLLELGPFLNADNRLDLHQVSEKVPQGTRSIRVTLLALGSEGVSYVYFDNVSLTLSP